MVAGGRTGWGQDETVVNRKSPDSTTTWSSRWTARPYEAAGLGPIVGKGARLKIPQWAKATSLIPFYLGAAPAHPREAMRSITALNPTGYSRRIEHLPKSNSFAPDCPAG